MNWTAVTLCFLLRDGAAGTQVLLGTKKTGFGVGKIVGLGGHVEVGESHAEAACREVFEEAGIVVREHDLRVAGRIEFVFPSRPEWNMSTSLFTARRWTGEPAESSEIMPNGSRSRPCRWSACGKTPDTGCRWPWGRARWTRSSP